MDSLDYLDWSRMSGLYLRNVSHVDRYRTFKPLISRPGWITLIVAEFLENADPVIDVGKWRTLCVYEMGAEKGERIALTAEALDAIGATRISAAVRTAQSHSPFEKITEMLSSGGLTSMDDLRQLMKGTSPVDLISHMREHVARAMPDFAEKAGVTPAPGPPPAVSPDHESREQIEHLLEQFIAAHRSELQHDLERHRDPRRQPGFTREKRLKEIDAMRERLYAAQRQKDDAATMKDLMDQVKKLTGNPNDGKKKSQIKLEKLGREFKGLFKQHRKTPADELGAEMAVVLGSAEAFMASHPDVFEPKLVDEKYVERLSLIGDYEVQRSGGQILIQWDRPAGCDCEWADFGLTVAYPKKNPELLDGLLNAVDLVRSQFSAASDEWRAELLESFRDVYQSQMDDWSMEDYETDDDGNATDDSILSHVDDGQIYLEAEPDGAVLNAHVHFGVDWDDEHGYDVEWELQTQDASAAGDFDVESLGMESAGPKLSAADIEQFESSFGVKLPADYAQFLLAINGGCPRRRRFTAGSREVRVEANVVRWFSILGNASETHPPGSLEAAVEHTWARMWPSELLPIAEARIVGLSIPGENDSEYLLLILSGPKAGRVILANPDSAGEMFPGLPVDQSVKMNVEMMKYLIDSSPVAGTSLAASLSRMQEPVQEAIPVWLQAIRDNDVAAFVEWIRSDGKSSEKFQSRGTEFPLSVTDYLVLEASPELLTVAVEGKLVKPSQLRDGWQRVCLGDLRRFRVLMPLLPKEMWKYALGSVDVWDDPTLLEELAQAGVDFNAPVNDEGQTPIHLAVQCGKVDAVRWLMRHGADPAKFDNYQRNAMTWTDRGPGYECLAVLQGKENIAPPRPARPDVSGIDQLRRAAGQVAEGSCLIIVVQIKSPPVTELERRLYKELHYQLSIDMERRSVTFKCMVTPRQDYIYATDDWPAVLFAPIIQWPELVPAWETLEVLEFDAGKAMKSRKYKPTPRPDLLDAARESLQQAFDAEEASARGIRIRK